MKKLSAVTLSSLVAICLLYPQAAKADQIIYCNPVYSNQESINSQAYANGFQQGEQSARNGEAYKPQPEGGEFARGFEDGYFNRPYSGLTEQYQNCSESGSYTVVPPTVIYSYPVAPPVIYNYPYPILNFDFGFGFGGWHHGWGHHGWWHHGRW